MVYETLKQEIIGLPDDKINLLIDFARFLKQEFNGIGKAEIKKNCIKDRKIGFMADDFVSIASDFDDCLEGLEEYV